MDALLTMLRFECMPAGMVSAILFYFSVRSNPTKQHADILRSVVGGIREIGFVFLGSAYSNEIGVYT